MTNVYDISCESDNDKVLVDRKYLERLEETQTWMDALEAAGVDNWDGYDEALLILEEWDGEEEE